jgi:methyl-accepting chemotaxis protein
VAAEVDRLTRQIGEVAGGMTEQATATGQITRSVEDMRKQAGQVAQAIAEQARATRDMTAGVAEVARQVSLVTRANRQHSAAGEAILKALTDIRTITTRNARGVEDTRRNTDGLRERTAALAALADRLAGARPPAARRRNTGRRR